MDVQVCWANLLNALEADRWVEAAEIADDLLDWLAKGGMPPTITNRMAIDKLLAKSVATTVATWEA